MKKIACLIMLFASLAACKKDFLEKQPLDTLQPESFYQNGDNLKTALLGVYDALQAENLFGKLPELDGISDNGELFKYETELIAFGQGIASPNTTQKLATYYQYAFQLVQRSNMLLDHIQAPGNLSDADRTAIEAEAKALRAIAYMRLVYLYGSVPLYTHFLPPANINRLTRTDRDSVVAFVLEELENAGNQLGAQPYNNEKGRLTRQAVKGLQAKVLVYEARLHRKSWLAARTALVAVINQAEAAGIGLFTTVTPANGQANYEGLFAQANADNKEILFAVKNNDLDRGVNLYTYFGAGGGNLYFAVHTNFVDDFYCTDGLPITSSPLYSKDQPYTHRDPRLKASITVPGDTYSSGTALLPFKGRNTIGVLQTDFAVKKLTTLDGLKQNQGQLDIPLLRYADILLLFAEAENEVNGPTAAAYDAVNRVRTRVNMPGLPTGLSASQFHKEVIHERRVELGFEGQRWYDLVTLDIAAQTINAIPEGNRRFVPGKQELLPIPQSEINQNQLLGQNKGY